MRPRFGRPRRRPPPLPLARRRHRLRVESTGRDAVAVVAETGWSGGEWSPNWVNNLYLFGSFRDAGGEDGASVSGIPGDVAGGGDETAFRGGGDDDGRVARRPLQPHPIGASILYALVRDAVCESCPIRSAGGLEEVSAH
eukprot:ctg_476.g268